jgi:hypothetical protein
MQTMRLPKCSQADDGASRDLDDRSLLGVSISTGSGLQSTPSTFIGLVRGSNSLKRCSPLEAPGVLRTVADLIEDRVQHGVSPNRNAISYLWMCLGDCVSRGLVSRTLGTSARKGHVRSA